MDEKIQLPPIKKGTSGDVVKMLWEFMQLSDEGKEQVEQMMLDINQSDVADSENQEQRFEEAFKELYRDLIQQSAKLTCFVYDCRYNKGWSLGEIIDAYPALEILITAISIQMDMIMDQCNDMTQ